MSDNGRTSIAMLENFYLKHVRNQLSIEKITGVTKTKKRKAEEIVKKAENLRVEKALAMFKEATRGE